MIKKDKLIVVLEKWLKSHPHSEDVSWHIQNLLGDYYGWESEEQKYISSLLQKNEIRK